MFNIYKERIGRLLCKLGFHLYSDFEVHPHKGNWATRHCQRKKCFRLDDRRLF